MNPSSFQSFFIFSGLLFISKQRNPIHFPNKYSLQLFQLQTKMQGKRVEGRFFMHKNWFVSTTRAGLKYRSTERQWKLINPWVFEWTIQHGSMLCLDWSPFKKNKNYWKTISFGSEYSSKLIVKSIAFYSSLFNVSILRSVVNKFWYSFFSYWLIYQIKL